MPAVNAVIVLIFSLTFAMIDITTTTMWSFENGTCKSVGQPCDHRGDINNCSGVCNCGEYRDPSIFYRYICMEPSYPESNTGR
uniref:Defensin n=1 Tax=Rhipicephalus appendiculatus TaxID=34631 RepID=A0A131YHS3_RHIAP